MFEHGAPSEERFLRRRQAADYLQSKYGFGAMATLAKGAVTGDTPHFQKAGKNRPLYEAIPGCMGAEKNRPSAAIDKRQAGARGVRSGGRRA